MRNAVFFIGVMLMAMGYLALGYLVPREAFNALFTLVIGLFVQFFSVYRRGNEKQLYWISIAMRVLFLLAVPVLSDDYFRFIWDGRLIALGENPYLHTPSYYFNGNPLLNQLGSDLYAGMNSPDYFTVYPPFCQSIFLTSAVAGQNTLGSIVVMRCLIIAADLGTIHFGRRLLTYFNLPSHRIFLYALNPLIIIEFTGNLHFEGIMLFFLVGSIYLLVTNRWVVAAVFFAFSVNTKLLPLMLLPLLIPPLGWGKSVRFGLLSGSVILIMFLPFLSSELVRNFMSSIDLYFQKFEFNASLYYVVRWIGFKIYGYNTIQTIGKIFPFVVLTGIIILTWYNRKRDWDGFFRNALFAFLIYLSCASIVHPWYISTLVLVGVFTRYRFAVVWSLLAFLSYWAYSNSNYQENLWLVGVEYGIVFLWLLAEWYYSPKNQILVQGLN